MSSGPGELWPEPEATEGGWDGPSHPESWVGWLRSKSRRSRSSIVSSEDSGDSKRRLLRQSVISMRAI